MIGNLGKWCKKTTATDLANPFSKESFPDLASNVSSNAASNAINKFDTRTSGKRAATARKGFTLFISNEDMDDIVKIVTKNQVD